MRNLQTRQDALDAVRWPTMTPGELLRSLHKYPEDRIIYHEIGHLIAGLSLGIPEMGIAFLLTNGSDLARAYFQSNNVSPRKLIARALAGAYCQAMFCPTSIEKELRQKIILGTAFTKTNLDSKCQTADMLASAGFKDDMQGIRDTLFAIKSERDKAKVLWATRHRIKGLLMEGPGRACVRKIFLDINKWMDREMENRPIEMKPGDISILYPVQRAETIYSEASRRHQEQKARGMRSLFIARGCKCHE